MRQYVARPGQECKSELIVGAGLERIRILSILMVDAVKPG